MNIFLTHLFSGQIYFCESVKHTTIDFILLPTFTEHEKL